ncbi:LysM domain-containing protein [Nakamurella panacisegetis]|uniref:LysM domain-containing protein n=1 Tax=Nakamurella panacisegetis TaxID=1090615 RepID=A0A1H0I6K7_9ACTN|nr:LysM domain-containing protein [Nakamurella panacisegetis]SDO27027.1 LysM domain-containing protein [Nakamurella panacisegetis]
MFTRAKLDQTWSNGRVDLNLGTASHRELASSRQAWFQLAGALSGLVVLAVALPAPSSVRAVLAGPATSADRPAQLVASVALAAASLLVWTLLTWAILVALVALGGHLPGSAGRSAHVLLGRIAPKAARKLVLSVVGVSLMSGLAVGGAPGASAVSAPPGADQSSASGPSGDTATTSWTPVEGSAVQLDRVPVPTVGLDRPEAPTPTPLDIDWPTTPSTSGAAVGSPARTVDVDWPRSTEPVVVRRGDSLWSIAAAHLPAGASPAEITQAWHRWYAANKSVIGADPDRILPGQILLPPTQPNGE